MDTLKENTQKMDYCEEDMEVTPSRREHLLSINPRLAKG